MSLFQKSAIGTLTRRGQATLHFIRMIAQVIGKFSLPHVPPFAATFWPTVANMTTSYDSFTRLRGAAPQVSQTQGPGSNNPRDHR